MKKPLTLSKNSCLILENVILNGKISQNEIANQTNINRSLVSKEVANLETTNLISIENDKNKKVLSFNQNFGNTILIEIDRYFIHGFLNTSLGKNIEKVSINIDVMNVSDLFTYIEHTIDKFLELTDKQIIGIGFSVHGIVEENHVISYAPNTKWNNLNIKDVIEKKYDIFTTVLNVANVSVLTENVIAKPSINSLVSVNIHSGVGAGLILDNKLFIGASGHSLEIGHFQLLGFDNTCDCGEQGCLETEISYPRIIDKMKTLGITDASIDKFIELYQQGNKEIEAMYDEYLTLLSSGIRNLYLVIDPSILKINCEIFQAIPKSVEILKSKVHSPIVNGSNISISTLNSSTRCMGLSVQLTKGFLGLDSINLYSQRNEFINSYK